MMNIEHKMCRQNLITVSVEKNYTFYLQCIFAPFFQAFQELIYKQVNPSSSDKSNGF
jgi:hypothetical protein